ncbi:MAG: N-acetylmuramoyl-L-alanine amidase [Eubacteriales bacterium]
MIAKNRKSYFVDFKRILYVLKYYFFILLYIIMAIVIFAYAKKNISHMNAFSIVTSVETQQPLVIVDAGHGGMDGGAHGSGGILEKDINLSVSLKLEQFLKMADISCLLTRRDDRMLGDEEARKRKAADLNGRIAIANENPSALFVSVHMNKFPQAQYSGLQVFYSANNPSSKTAAEIVQTNIKAQLQPDNDRQIKPGKSIYMLQNIRSPAIIVECGFLSNPGEEKLLTQDEYQSKLAFLLFCSIVEYLEEQDK